MIMKLGIRDMLWHFVGYFIGFSFLSLCSPTVKVIMELVICFSQKLNIYSQPIWFLFSSFT